MPTNELSIKMSYIGLLTHKQKQSGYFVSQDEDFIYLWHGRNGSPRIVSIFLYDTATIKEVREKAEYDLKGNRNETLS